MGTVYRILGVLAIVLLALLFGCSKQHPLTNDKAKELLEASSDFQPRIPDFTLTDDEIQKGLGAGYWELSKQAEHHRENGQSLLLTSEGMHYFSGTPPMRRPIISLRQKLGANLLEIKDIQPFPNASDYAVVNYTWIWKFENQIPELAELLKDQPIQEGKKTFHYESNGWEIALQ